MLGKCCSEMLPLYTVARDWRSVQLLKICENRVWEMLKRCNVDQKSVKSENVLKIMFEKYCRDMLAYTDVIEEM